MPCMLSDPVNIMQWVFSHFLENIKVLKMLGNQRSREGKGVCVLEYIDCVHHLIHGEWSFFIFPVFIHYFKPIRLP